MLVVEGKPGKFIAFQLLKRLSETLCFAFAFLARPVGIEVDDFTADARSSYKNSAARTAFNDPSALHPIKDCVNDPAARVEIVDDLPHRVETGSRGEPAHLDAQFAVKIFRLLLISDHC